MPSDDVDFAVAAVRDGGRWQVSRLDDAVGEDVDEFLDALEALRSEVGVIGFVSINDEFFVAARTTESEALLLLSDVTTVTDWPLASGVADVLDVPDPDDDEEPQPAGHMDLFSDLGMPARELAALCDDFELYPEDVLSDIADRLGFGADFKALIG